MAWRTDIVDESFYDEEIRCGYKVSTKLKKIWAVELDLISELLRVCKENDIKVCAFAGTMLGAVRHKGFIPWDDDMDVCMTREEFNKLCKIAPKAFKYPYFLQTALNDREFFCPYGRFRNSETTGIITYNNSPNYNNGILIDVFVLDGYVEDKFLFYSQYIQWRFFRQICDNYNSYKHGFVYKPVDKIANILGNKIGRIKEYEYWVGKYNNVVSRYNYTADRIGLYDLGRHFLSRYWCYKIELSDIIYVPFENIEIPIPRNYDVILKRIYGDYMKYPPVDERGAWHEGQMIFQPYLMWLYYLMRKSNHQHTVYRQYLFYCNIHLFLNPYGSKLSWQYTGM